MVPTLKFLPGSEVISCLAMSGHRVRFALAPSNRTMSASDSQSRCAVHAYVPAGDACVTRVVVTMPVAFPAHWAHWSSDVVRRSAGTDASQSPSRTAAVTPMVPLLPFTPFRYAVAEHAESATWLLTQYVCKKRHDAKSI